MIDSSPEQRATISKMNLDFSTTFCCTARCFSARKYLLTLLLMIVGVGTSYGQSSDSLRESTQHYMDTVFKFIQKKSLYRKEVNWISLRDSVARKSANAKTIEDLMPCITYIFESIGDTHGFMIYKNRWYGKERKLPEFRSELKAAVKLAFEIRIGLLDKKVGYVMVPGNHILKQAEANRHAQQIQDSVCKLFRAGARSWIVDLRLNTGGNMYPMIAGLSGILEDGVLGYFIGPDDEEAGWKLENGTLTEGGKLRTEIVKGCPITSGSKVSVLISQATGSSGEATAIAFKGRPNTKFFGENTFGFVSANEDPFFVDRNSMLVVASSYEADRDHKVYRDFVRPDVLLIEGDNFTDLTKDRKVQAALKWLKQKSK